LHSLQSQAQAGLRSVSQVIGYAFGGRATQSRLRSEWESSTASKRGKLGRSNELGCPIVAGGPVNVSSDAENLPEGTPFKQPGFGRLSGVLVCNSTNISVSGSFRSADSRLPQSLP